MTINPPINHVTQDHAETLQIEWIVSNVCNYSCSYCISDLHDGSSRWPNVDDALEFFWEIEKLHKNRPKHLVMTGGEPTMWPQLIEFTDRLPESYILDISTNGSRTLRFWRDFSEKSKFQKVNISAHLADCDIEHLIESL